MPKVAVFLQNVKYKNTTLLSELWQAFKDLLGFGSKDTALSEWFGLNEEMTKQGLRITLPRQLDLGGTGVTMSMLDINRTIKPYLPNAALDDTLGQLEAVVASRVTADMEKKLLQQDIIYVKKQICLFMQQTLVKYRRLS